LLEKGSVRYYADCTPQNSHEHVIKMVISQVFPQETRLIVDVKAQKIEQALLI